MSGGTWKTPSDAGKWREVTLPILDRMNDRISFYVKTVDGITVFTDDGWTLANLADTGRSPAGGIRERVAGLVRRFGATLEADGQITMETRSDRSDAMDRFVRMLAAAQNMGA